MWLFEGLGHRGRKGKREEEHKQAMRPRKKTFQRKVDWRKKQSLTERKRKRVGNRKTDRSLGGRSKRKKKRRKKGRRMRYLSTFSPPLHSETPPNCLHSDPIS